MHGAMRFAWVPEGQTLICVAAALVLACCGADAATDVAGASYEHKEAYAGPDFFSKWDFFNEEDPTHGTVQYLDEAAAKAAGLAKVDKGHVWMGADMTATLTPGNGAGRSSVRVQSKAVYNAGLFVLDLSHIPTGCGTWPAFWMYGEDATHVWPAWGEFDIIEGVHRSTRLLTTLHTSAGCEQSSLVPGQDFASYWEKGLSKQADDCDVGAWGQWGNQGCSQAGPQDSMGWTFNSRGGGTFAAEWDPKGGHFRTWFWPRGAEPPELAEKSNLDPDSWGMPYSFFRLSEANCPTSHFQNMKLVFDLTFCGDLGSPTFAEKCPEIKESCEQFVSWHPQNMTEAYWSINSLDVYQRKEAVALQQQSHQSSQSSIAESGTTSQAPEGKSGTATPAPSSYANPPAPSPPEARCKAQSRKPLSQVDPSIEFIAVDRVGDASAPKVFSGKSGPLPTDAWWENVALAGNTATEKGNIFQMPYVLLTDNQAIHVMQPFSVGGNSEAESFDKFEAVSFGTVEELNGKLIETWDELSVTIAWQSTGGANIGMQTPIVRGSPYITAEYSGMTPRITSEQELRNGEQSIIEGRDHKCDGTALTGFVFVFEFLQSDATWLFFPPKGTQWICHASPFSLVGVEPLHGAVRIALANNCTTGQGARRCDGAPARGRDTVAYATLLLQHAGTFPVGACVNYTVEDDVGSVTWAWSTRSLRGWRPTDLLQLAWPVHLPLLSKGLRQRSQRLAKPPFRDIRGPAVPVLGAEWQMSYALFPDVGLQGPRPVAEGLRSEILEALTAPWGALWNGSLPDRDFDLPLNYQLGVGDTYFSGKMLARLARLVAVADELGEASQPYFSTMVDRLRRRMEAWLAPNSETPFLYDRTWGGIVHCGCEYDDCQGNCRPHCSNSNGGALDRCPGLVSGKINFGNGFYNDHHFHYGYFVFAAAVLAKHIPAWELKWRGRILGLIRDYGNPSPEDESFPVARHKDWFMGFSWTGGIQAMPNGRNQESVSEAINSYYALYAYGASVDAPFSNELKDFGRLLAAMESHGADVYWHVRTNSNIYDDSYQHSVVGILWEHLAQYQTWFGGDPFVVSGVQLLPFTPMMESALSADWVFQDLSILKAECEKNPKCADEGWSSLVCLEEAVLDPKSGHACLKSLPKEAFSVSRVGSNGNSLTNALHWIATRPRAADLFPATRPVAETALLGQISDMPATTTPMPWPTAEQTGSVEVFKKFQTGRAGIERASRLWNTFPSAVTVGGVVCLLIAVVGWHLAARRCSVFGPELTSPTSQGSGISHGILRCHAKYEGLSLTHSPLSPSSSRALSRTAKASGESAQEGQITADTPSV